MAVRLVPDAGAPQGDALFTAALGKADASVPGKRRYTLDVCRPTVSVWLENDQTAQFMSGCTVESAEWAVDKSGLCLFTFSGRGRKSGVTGVAELAEEPATTAVRLLSGQAMAFSKGGYVTNRAKADGLDFRITAVDTDTDALILDAAPVGWASGDVIGPWFPETTPIGLEVENNSVTLLLDGAEGKIRPSTFTASLPTQFLEEIGDEYPGESADNKRSVSMDMSVYFRRKDMARFGESLEGKTISVGLKAKNANGSISVAMPRVRISAPTIGEDDAVLTLDSTGTALGLGGEDSFSITLEKAVS